MLSKNPAGVAALVSTLADGSGDVVVSINDGIADGRDPSWLYDAPFEELGSRRVWCHGSRALDLAVRLEYGGLDVRVCDTKLAFAQQISANEPIDVIANYTAFAEWMRVSAPC
jgi:hypothetical protein